MQTHELKCWPEYFQAIKRGEKTFEVRQNDRCFEVGDTLLLQEYDPKAKSYTGDEISRIVTYLLEDEGFTSVEDCCVMSLSATPTGVAGGEPADALRHAFEVWADARGYDITPDEKDGDNYKALPTNLAWEVWQDATLAAATPLGAGQPVGEREGGLPLDAVAQRLGLDIFNYTLADVLNAIDRQAAAKAHAEATAAAYKVKFQEFAEKEARHA